LHAYHFPCIVLVFVREKARKYAIVKELDEPVSLKDGTVVLQFETRSRKGLNVVVHISNIFDHRRLDGNQMNLTMSRIIP